LPGYQTLPLGLILPGNFSSCSKIVFSMGDKDVFGHSYAKHSSLERAFPEIVSSSVFGENKSLKEGFFQIKTLFSQPIY
jgi:hypothetical protein